MKYRYVLVAVAAALIAFATVGNGAAQEIDVSEVKAGRYDNGKMWTFDYPPVDHLQDTYGLSPDEAWFEKARLGALRLPNCTASFVSPYGLVMTNHHCARGSVQQVSAPGERLLENGFTSGSLEAERQVPGLYVDQLIALEDVTDEVYAAVEAGETDAEKAAARQETIAEISARITDTAGGEEAGVVVQVINLYNGGKYSAYTFRRFDDVRLVMAPELQLGYFGGDTDNFTYPRYALDMSFLRVYVDDKPYEPEHYFAWSAEGADEGDAVFVVGNPGSTLRLETVAQLEYRRDVQEKAIVSLLDSRIAAMMAVYEENPSPAFLNQIFGLRNSQKLYKGRVKGLNNPVIMAKRADTERQFLADLERRFADTASPEMPAPYFDIIDELGRIQEEKREYAAEFSAFLAMQPASSLASATVARALVAYDYLRAKESGSADTDQVVQQLSNIDQDPALDRRFMTARINDIVANIGKDDPGVVQMLGGRTVDEVVEDIVTRSALTTSVKAADAIGSDALTMEDPAIQLISPFMERRQNAQSALAGLGAQEQELNARHGRARFEIYGTSRPPDATFSLRIADGVVGGYDYNGTMAPPFTTFYGLYDRYAANHLDPDGTGEWELPERWLNAPSTFDRSVPLNLVATNDIIGGNSGSPMLNSDLEVIGLIFDGNIESLPSAFIYQTEVARSVGVDVRGMREALAEIYGMDRIVKELMQHEMADIGDEVEGDE